MPVGFGRDHAKQVLFLCSRFFSSFTFIKLTGIETFDIIFSQPYFFLNIYKKSAETKKMSFNVGTDQDPVVICPYDRNHRIARSRIQRHLVKCEKNFPPGFKKQCPYDATHRVFEHELVEHVKNCPMKHTCPIVIGQTRYVSSEVSMQQEQQFDDDQETWDEDVPDDSIANSPDQKFFHSSKQNSDMVMIKRYSGKLRPPHGYSESLMLETSNTDIDEDAPSVTSDMGIGRGRSIPFASNGQYKRGTTIRQGIRGRLLP